MGRLMKCSTGVALVFLAGVVWSVQGLIIKSIHDAGPWAVLYWRSAGMVPVLLLWLAVGARGRVWAQMRSAGLAGVLGGIGLVMAFSGAIHAFQTTSVANAVVLFTASPFFAAVLGRALLREAVPVVTWVAMALAVLGVGVLVGGGMAGGSLSGNAAALLSALGFAGFTVTCRWGKLTNMLPAVLLGGIFALLTGALATQVLGQPLLIPPRDIALAAAMGAVTLSGGLILFTIGSRVVPAAQATLISLVEVLLAPVWAYAVLGEVAATGTLIGGAVLLAAVVMNAYGGRKTPGA